MAALYRRAILVRMPTRFIIDPVRQVVYTTFSGVANDRDLLAHISARSPYRLS
jgi:hypothetical protein